MSTSNKKNLLKSICTANVRCSCGKPKPSDVIEPKPKSKITSIISNPTQNNPNPCSSSSSSLEKSNNNAEHYTSTTISFNNVDTSTQSSESEPDSKATKTLSSCPKIVDSVAVVKESTNPYEDFRRSMMQMIMEKEIYSKEDLQELLNCFLELNSPVHHDVIVQAFNEIRNEASISRKLNEQPHPHVHHGDHSHESKAPNRLARCGTC